MLLNNLVRLVIPQHGLCVCISVHNKTQSRSGRVIEDAAIHNSFPLKRSTNITIKHTLCVQPPKRWCRVSSYLHPECQRSTQADSSISPSPCGQTHGAAGHGGF